MSLPKERDPNFDHEFAKTSMDRIDFQDGNQGPNAEFDSYFDAIDSVIEQASEPKITIIEDGT